MDTSTHPTGRGAIDAHELGRYLRQRITQLEADAITAGRAATEAVRAERPDHAGAVHQMHRSMRLSDRAAELRRVLQDYGL